MGFSLHPYDFKNKKDRLVQDFGETNQGLSNYEWSEDGSTFSVQSVSTTAETEDYQVNQVTFKLEGGDWELIDSTKLQKEVECNPIYCE